MIKKKQLTNYIKASLWYNSTFSPYIFISSNSRFFWLNEGNYLYRTKAALYILSFELFSLQLIRMCVVFNSTFSFTLSAMGHKSDYGYRHTNHSGKLTIFSLMVNNSVHCRLSLDWQSLSQWTKISLQFIMLLSCFSSVWTGNSSELMGKWSDLNI